MNRWVVSTVVGIELDKCIVVESSVVSSWRVSVLIDWELSQVVEMALLAGFTSFTNSVAWLLLC